MAKLILELCDDLDHGDIVCLSHVIWKDQKALLKEEPYLEVK